MRLSCEDNPGLLSVLQSRLGDKVPHSLRRESDKLLCSPNGNDAMGRGVICTSGFAPFCS